MQPGVHHANQSFMVCGSRFDVPPEYELIKPIGQGAYGVVCSATCIPAQDKVAVKKIGKAFEHTTDAKRTLREIKLLRHFHHENVMSIRDILAPPSYEAFDDVIISSPQGLSDDHCQYFLYQILRALKYVHSAHVLHRDIKPSNMLVNSNCDLKLCDFGLARVAQPGLDEGFMTEYVATRWYRAPEIMLSWKEYTEAIDIWAAGCVFAELIGRKALFPGRDYIHQLNLIIDVLGTPSPEDMANIGSSKARHYMQSLPFKPQIPFSQLYPGASPFGLDLLSRMLSFNPARRPSAAECLEHPYLAALHDPTDEPMCPTAFQFDFEGVALSKQQLKRLIFQEMAGFHPEVVGMDVPSEGLLFAGEGMALEQ